MASVALARDVAVAIVVTVVGVVRDIRRFAAPVGAETPARPYLLPLPPWVVIAAHLLGGVLILGRRRRPELTAILLALLSVLVPVFAAIAMTYSVVRYGRRIPPAVALSVLLVLTSLGGAGLLPLLGDFRWTDGDPYTLVLVGALLTAVGLYRRAASDLRVAVAAQVEQAASEQRARAENERLRERAALAVELHDEVARHLSLLCLTATHSDDDPDGTQADERLEILTHARAASESLYALIRALTGSPLMDEVDPASSDPASFDPAPSNAATEALAAFAALGRLDGVVLDPIGAADDRVDDPAWPVLAAVAAEGVVNARRHAPGSTVRLGLTTDDNGWRLTISNTAGTQPTTQEAGAGLGLQSARGRCAALGGTLETRPEPDGGLQVVAVVPATVGARR